MPRLRPISLLVPVLRRRCSFRLFQCLQSWRRSARPKPVRRSTRVHPIARLRWWLDPVRSPAWMASSHQSHNQQAQQATTTRSIETPNPSNAPVPNEAVLPDCFQLRNPGLSDVCRTTRRADDVSPRAVTYSFNSQVSPTRSTPKLWCFSSETRRKPAR